MTKKQKLLLIGIATLIMVMIGSTSAFFATSSRTHNIITTDGVSIELIEDTEETGSDGRPVPFKNIDNARPGETYSKIPQIKNTDNTDAYVRIKLVTSVAHADGTSNKVLPSIFRLDFSRSWSYRDGYYYFMRTLHAGETTTPLFTTVTIPGKLSGEYEGSTFSLGITGEAVQAANNGDNALNAEGWPEE